MCGVEAGSARIEGVLLLRAEPNPFRGETVVRLGLQRAGPVRLSVHDGSGRRVATLVDQPLSPGWATIIWGATGTDGRRLGPGLYFLVGQAGGSRVSCKLVVLE